MKASLSRTSVAVQEEIPGGRQGPTGAPSEYFAVSLRVKIFSGSIADLSLRFRVKTLVVPWLKLESILP